MYPSVQWLAITHYFPWLFVFHYKQLFFLLSFQENRELYNEIKTRRCTRMKDLDLLILRDTHSQSVLDLGQRPLACWERFGWIIPEAFINAFSSFTNLMNSSALETINSNCFILLSEKLRPKWEVISVSHSLPLHYDLPNAMTIVKILTKFFSLLGMLLSWTWKAHTDSCLTCSELRSRCSIKHQQSDQEMLRERGQRKSSQGKSCSITGTKRDTTSRTPFPFVFHLTPAWTARSGNIWWWR